MGGFPTRDTTKAVSRAMNKSVFFEHPFVLGCRNFGASGGR